MARMHGNPHILRDVRGRTTRADIFVACFYPFYRFLSAASAARREKVREESPGYYTFTQPLAGTNGENSRHFTIIWIKCGILSVRIQTQAGEYIYKRVP